MKIQHGMMIAICLLLGAGAILYIKFPNVVNFEPTRSTSSVEISGWIAWWKEADAYALLRRKGKSFHSISPYWFDIDKTFNLKDVSPDADKGKTTQLLAADGIEVFPLINTPLTFEQLSPLFIEANSERVTTQIVEKLASLNAKGADIDIEEVSPSDQVGYQMFLTKLHSKLAAHGMKMSVSLIAQTGVSRGAADVLRGVDYGEIGKIADTVNILAYDLHSTGSEAGPITSIDWLKQVITYAKSTIDPTKLVIALPMYGYNWQLQSTTPDPYPYDEFVAHFDNDKNFSKERDAASGELRYVGPGQEAWVSDAYAVKVYIKTAQELGLDRFMIWQIGGMDENIL